MPINDANDFLMGGGGAPPAKFETTGTIQRGEILEAEVRQQTDAKTNEPKFWKDGNPMMQAVITIQTDQRDPAVEDDDGKRRLFVKGAMQKAVREAVLAAGGKALEVGGTLAIQYTGDGQPPGKGMNPPKLYVAEYRKPSIGVGMLGGDTPPAAPVTAPAPSAPAAPAAEPVSTLLG